MYVCCRPIADMTYNVFNWALNLPQPLAVVICLLATYLFTVFRSSILWCAYCTVLEVCME